ncbi:unnamed protein product [Linum tenue]|uniref:Uncharacterized protein n=2 Tax=Linum tenue TaxID=586396 RepID=A0AAV0M6R7_9ROSI|nr:unnamed protein product [Linum tenue]
MSAFENVVGGKLKLKGKALDVKAGGTKKKKKHKKVRDEVSQVIESELTTGKAVEESSDVNEEVAEDASKMNNEDKSESYKDHLTAAEKRYIEQRERLDRHKMAKEANKSHRDRIQGFNQYLANMSEHYDIPKVGPG